MNTEKLIPEWLKWPQTARLIGAFLDDTLRFVGGAVRDAVLEKTVTDVDAATTLPPEEVIAALEKVNIRVIPTGIDHGTVTAVIDGKSFEITTLRKDVATDGRHATIAYTDDWKEDASRRDFTMNALYLSPQGRLFDYFGGVEDAKAGRVRFIGDPLLRIGEDYLRILRFFRFYARYGKGEPDKAALTACRALANGIDQLSGERIQQEMMKLLSVPDPSAVLALIQKHGIAPHVFSGDINVSAMTPVKALEKEIASPPLPLVRLVALLGNDDMCLGGLADRWRLSNQDQKRLKQLQHTIPPDLSLAGQKRHLYENGPELFAQTVMISASRIGDAAPYAKIIHLPEHWQPPAFPVSGDDLIALGIKPGKNMGELLQRLEETWETSDYKLGKEELLAHAR